MLKNESCTYFCHEAESSLTTSEALNGAARVWRALQISTENVAQSWVPKDASFQEFKLLRC